MGSSEAYFLIFLLISLIVAILIISRYSSILKENLQFIAGILGGKLKLRSLPLIFEYAEVEGWYKGRKAGLVVRYAEGYDITFYIKPLFPLKLKKFWFKGKKITQNTRVGFNRICYVEIGGRKRRKIIREKIDENYVRDIFDELSDAVRIVESNPREYAE